MIKKPDLRIDTQFFDDNLNGLHIPEAIRITQSVDTQTFIKEGLNDQEMDGTRLLAIETIERILSRHLFENFVQCWSQLKSNKTIVSSMSTPYSQKGHARQKSLLRNASNNIEINTSHTQFRRIEQQRVKFNHIRTNLQGGATSWLEQQRRIIKSKSVSRAKSQGKSMSAETHYQRAKVLKQIVDKLKHGRQIVTGLVTEFENKRENEQIHLKLNRLQKLMIEVRASNANKAPPVSQKVLATSFREENRGDIDNELAYRLKQQLMDVKSQMEKIRRTNQQILKGQQWKKAEIAKFASTKQQMQQQYQTLRYQMSNFEREKQVSQMNTIRLQQELSRQSSNRQEYERQLSYLSQRLNEAQIRQRERERISKEVQKSMALKTNNTFGYSTYTTTQRYGQPTVSKWEQSDKTLKAVPPSIVVNEPSRQSTDDWACC